MGQSLQLKGRKNRGAQSSTERAKERGACLLPARIVVCSPGPFARARARCVSAPSRVEPRQSRFLARDAANGMNSALRRRPPEFSRIPLPAHGERRAESGERRAESGVRSAECGERRAGEPESRRAIQQPPHIAGLPRSAVWRQGANTLMPPAVGHVVRLGALADEHRESSARMVINYRPRRGCQASGCHRRRFFFGFRARAAGSRA